MNIDFVNKSGYELPMDTVTSDFIPRIGDRVLCDHRNKHYKVVDVKISYSRNHVVVVLDTILD